MGIDIGGRGQLSLAMIRSLSWSVDLVFGPSTSVHPKLFFCLVLGLQAVAGCGPADLFTGEWQSQAGSCEGSAAIPGCAEVVIGQYGNDGAGIMRLYQNDAFNVPWPICPCIQLRDGKKVRTTMTLIADLSLCPLLEENYGDQLTIELQSIDDFLVELRVQAIGDATPITSVDLDRLEHNLIKFDSDYPDRSCDPETESGTGYEAP